ncbi:MAG: cellulase family glycosylhydrolase [Candidatus Promineifilaceae bacterium]
MPQVKHFFSRLRRLSGISWLLPLLFATLLFAAVGCEPQKAARPPAVSSSTPALAVIAVATPQPTATSTLLPTATTAATEEPHSSPTVFPSATLTVGPTATPSFPRYTGTPLQKDQLGIQVHIHQEDQRQILRHLQELGVGWVKVQVSWKLYEPGPESYTADRFAELDRLVEGATNNGIQVLLSVSKAPEWSRPTTELDGPPTDYDLYRRFMAYLAKRYQGRVAAYELWNEPNLQREWNGMPLNAADMVALVAAGAAGVREVDPMATIISGAPATTGINDGFTAIDDRQYLRSMLDAGVANSVNAIGVHPYGWANPPDSSYAHPDPEVPSHNNHPSFFFSDTLADYKALLTEYQADLPLWATEFGWGSFEGLVNDRGEPAEPPAGAEFMLNVTEWEQAGYVLRAFELAGGDQAIGPLFLWNLNFGPLLGADYSESGYSILRPDNSRRPAYLSLEAAKKT